jgi:type IV secretory pathway VirB10-like protein
MKDGIRSAVTSTPFSRPTTPPTPLPVSTPKVGDQRQTRSNEEQQTRLTQDVEDVTEAEERVGEDRQRRTDQKRGKQTIEHLDHLVGE